MVCLICFIVAYISSLFICLFHKHETINRLKWGKRERVILVQPLTVSPLEETHTLKMNFKLILLFAAAGKHESYSYQFKHLSLLCFLLFF